MRTGLYFERWPCTVAAACRATAVKSSVWCLLSLKHLVGRLPGADQRHLVRCVQRVSGVHGEAPEQSGVPGHGGPVRNAHQLHSDVSLALCNIWLFQYRFCVYVVPVFDLVSYWLLCRWRAALEHQEVAAIQWSWQVGERRRGKFQIQKMSDLEVFENSTNNHVMDFHVLHNVTFISLTIVPTRDELIPHYVFLVFDFLCLTILISGI